MGRNPVADSLRAGVSGTKLWVTKASQTDERVKQCLAAAGENGWSIAVVSDAELTQMTGSHAHQGCVLETKPFQYASIQDLFEVATGQVLVALDGVTDPQNLGAIVRSAEAFGAKGLVLPERRSAQVTPAVWKASAGAVARLPIARVVNLARAINDANDRGFQSIGLAAEADDDLSEIALRCEGDSILLVAGSEGSGLSRLVRERCTFMARIPHRSSAASLNVSVSVGIALYLTTNKLN